MKRSIGILFVFSFFLAQAQEDIDSLISTWNKLSAQYLEINEIDSACKYGNCVVDMMDARITKTEKEQIDHRLILLKEKKAEALSNLITAYGNSDRIDLSLECYQDALNIYSEIEKSEAIFHLHIRMARVNDLRSSYDEALPYYEMALNQAVANEDKESISLCYYYMGLNNRYLGNYSEALSYHLKDLQIAEDIKNKAGIANAYVTIAAILSTLKDNEAAMDKLLGAKELFEELLDSSGVAMVYNDLGKLYYDMGDTLKALDMHMKAAKLRELITANNGLGASNAYIANLYLEKGEHGKALHYVNLSEQAFRKASNRQGIMSSQIDCSEVYLDRGDLDSALMCLALAEQTAMEIMNYRGLTDVYTLRGGLRQLQRNHNEAIADFKKALAIALEHNNYQQIALLYANLAEIYQLMGDFKNAFSYQNSSILYQDTVNTNANIAAAIQMDTEYNYKKELVRTQLIQEKKDAINQAELTRQETQKQLFFGGVLMFLIISLGLWSRVNYIRKTNARLESEKDRAEQSEQFKQRFLANMSHEIRTPMNAVLGMTNLTLDTNLNAKQKKYLNAVKRSSQNLLVIINDILDLSKLEAGKMELENIPYKLKDIVDQVCDTLRFKAEEKGLAFSSHISKEVPAVLVGDPSRLNQILLNLCGNAIKFTDKGSVSIHIDFDKDDQSLLRFAIRDSGIGIPKDKIEKLFNAFHQADVSTTRKYGGTGLGLSISKTLVELHGGEMHVESLEGVGSEFSFTIVFQAAGENEMALINLDTAGSLSTLNGIRILLAEDNEFNRIVVHDTLENLISDVFIDCAENGKIAIRKLEENHFDVILMDVNMPIMDGLVATRHIRKQLPSPKREVPIIALTASVLNTNIQNCLDQGMNAFVPKPFKRDELMAALMQFYNNGNGSQHHEKGPAEVHENSVVVGEEPRGNIIDLSFLKDFCEGDEKRMQKYVEMYLKAAPQNLQKIAIAIEGSDYARLKRILHAMKPQLNYMGMKRARVLVDDVEALMEGGANPDEINQKIKGISNDCEQSLIELKELFESTKNEEFT